MTSTPPTSRQSPGDGPRPLALFKAPKAARREESEDTTTAIADAVFGRNDSHGDTSFEQSSETVPNSAVDTPGKTDGSLTEPGPDHVETESRHAPLPAENRVSPQTYPQGYPQADESYPQTYPQGYPQISPSYPQESASYPQEDPSYPQDGETEVHNPTESYPQADSDGSQHQEPAPEITEQATSRRSIADITEPPPTQPENPFAEAEARVLAQIQARQRAQELARQRAAKQEEDHRTKNPRSTQKQPTRTDTSPSGPTEPVSGGADTPPKRKRGNPFAEAEETTRAHDMARQASAERARAQAAAKARAEALAEQEAAIAAQQGRAPQRVETPTGSPITQTGPIHYRPGGISSPAVPVPSEPTPGAPSKDTESYPQPIESPQELTTELDSHAYNPTTVISGEEVGGHPTRHEQSTRRAHTQPGPATNGLVTQPGSAVEGIPQGTASSAADTVETPRRQTSPTSHAGPVATPSPKTVTPASPSNTDSLSQVESLITPTHSAPAQSSHGEASLGTESQQESLPGSSREFGIAQSQPAAASRPGHVSEPGHYAPTVRPEQVNPHSTSGMDQPRPVSPAPQQQASFQPPRPGQQVSAAPVTPQRPVPPRAQTPLHAPHSQTPQPGHVQSQPGRHPAPPPPAVPTPPPVQPAQPTLHELPEDTTPPHGFAVDPRLSSRPAYSQRSVESRVPEPGPHNQVVPYSGPKRSAKEDKPFRLPKPPKSKDRMSPQELAITEIAGHATFTPTSVTAWYRLPEVRWAFRPDAEREALISAISEQYAGMAGYRLHLRRTTRPFPADEWARTLDANTPRPMPGVHNAPTWADHLVNAQEHLHQIQHAEGQTYLGISFARRTLSDTLGERFGRLVGRGTRVTERTKIERATEQFDEVLGAYGVRARRATSHELEWLIYRSVALGMDPPELLSSVRDGLWEPGDVLALTEQIERYRTPYGSTVKLVNRLTDEERHVAVLTVGRMEDLEIPERHEPWLHFHERAPWTMELSSRLDVLGPGEAFRNLEHRLRMIRSQQADYDEHAMDAPPELERLARRALHVGDEMTTGMATDAARIHGWHRLAVSADSRDECLERARWLIKTYNRELRMSLQHPKNQDWLAREFIPGEPIANTGYLRRMPVRLFAAALPQAASTVGDKRGDLIGRTSGTCRRPVFLDLHYATEVRERSGLAVFVAEPGGGKSTLMGALGYLNARRGVQVTLLDPSGPLARLCDMPELKPYSKVLNLTGSESGTLAPYALIPTPKREHWGAGTEGDREFEIAVQNARAERRMLVQDICSMLVPPQVAREASTAKLFRHAARRVEAEETSTLEDIVKCLNDLDEDGSELAALLLDTAEMPLAKLFFGSPAEDMLTDDSLLTVITMAGLRLPDLKIEREYWSAEEALALPMLHTAHRLAVRRSYGGDINRRKLVGLDEAHFMEGWRSGRSFLVRMARDSRKWNLAALVASQNPKDILGLDVQNLVSTVFVGRIAEDNEIAAEALRMLRVPRDVGYEQTLASLSENDADDTRLSYREFIMRDVDGRVQRMRADVSYVPGLLDYLDTTPGGRTAAGRPGNALTRPSDAGVSQMGT